MNYVMRIMSWEFLFWDNANSLCFRIVWIFLEQIKSLVWWQHSSCVMVAMEVQYRCCRWIGRYFYLLKYSDVIVSQHKWTQGMLWFSCCYATSSMSADTLCLNVMDITLHAVPMKNYIFDNYSLSCMYCNAHMMGICTSYFVLTLTSL